MNADIWDMTPCAPCNRSFAGTYRLHLQGENILSTSFQRGYISRQRKSRYGNKCRQHPKQWCRSCNVVLLNVSSKHTHTYNSKRPQFRATFRVASTACPSSERIWGRRRACTVDEVELKSHALGDVRIQPAEYVARDLVWRASRSQLLVRPRMKERRIFWRMPSSDSAWLLYEPTFRRNVSPPSSRCKESAS
jgi:hypothetical protein